MASKTEDVILSSEEEEEEESMEEDSSEEEELSDDSDVVNVKSVPLVTSKESAMYCLFCYSPVLKYNCEQAKVERRLTVRTSERLLHYICNYLEFDKNGEELLMSRRSRREGQTRLLPGNLPLCLKCRMLYYHKIYDAFVQYELAIDSLNEKITACITKEIATSAKKNSESVEVGGGDEGVDGVLGLKEGSSKEQEVMMMVKQFRKKVAERNPTGYYTEDNKEDVRNALASSSSSSSGDGGSNSSSATDRPLVKNLIHVVKTNMADEMVRTVEDKQKESLERFQGLKQDMVKEIFDGTSAAGSSSSKNQPFQYYAVAAPSPGVIQIIPMKKPLESKGKKRCREPHYNERKQTNNTCKFCFKLLPDPLSLTRHMVHQHGMEKPEKCPKCEFRCIEKSYLARHLQTHLDESERINRFICDECGKGFKSKGGLRDHMDGHTGNRRMWTCDICGKKFKTRESKQMCENKHNDIKKFECSYPECGKMFLRKEVLKVHERTHTGEKPYKCEVCGKCFSQRSPLTTHLKNVHNK